MEQLESMVELIQYIVPSLLVDVGSAIFVCFDPIFVIMMQPVQQPVYLVSQIKITFFPKLWSRVNY